MKIEIHGRQVEVDDNFKDMSEDEQHKVVDEIASSFGPITAAATAEKEGPSTLANLGGGAEATALAYGVGLPKAALGAAKNLFGGVPAAPPPAPTNIPGEDRWFGSANAINEKAKIIRRNNELAKRYPGFERVTPPEPPVSVGQRAVSGLENLRTSKPGKSFSTGYNAMDALQHAGEGPLSNVQAGASALAAAAPWVEKHLPGKLKNIAKGLQLGVPAANYVIDKFTGQPVPAPEQKATGGAVQHFAGGKLATAAKMAAKMSPAIEGSLGKILPKSKPLTLAEKFGYDPVKLRNEYPQTSFPVSAWDKNKEAYYAAKNPSSEELALKAARDFAQEEIKSGSSAYKPYFDISKRGYVDPSNYPLPGPQTTSVIPKQQKTIDAYTAKFQNPEAIQKWSDAYELAKNSPNAHHFYAMDQLEKEYVKAYGPELGRQKFKTEFADQMANTTSGVTPTNNLLTAGYVNHMNASGLPLPGHAPGEYTGYSFDAPHPVQGGRIGANLAQSNKYAEAGNQLNPLENPKRYDFSGNFMGHQGLTMDEQMMTPFSMAAPPKGSYGLAELEGAKQAALKGVKEPSDWQSVTWAGLKALKDAKGKELTSEELSKIGQPMIEDVNQMIHRTSRVLGISQDEALAQLLKNKPIYGIGAIAGAGASKDEEPQTKKKGGKVKKGKKK